MKYTALNYDKERKDRGTSRSQISAGSQGMTRLCDKNDNNLICNPSPRLEDLCKECGLDHNFTPTLGEDKADDEIPSLQVMLQQRRLVVEKMEVALDQI